jgi:DNA mismatch repair protein MutL
MVKAEVARRPIRIMSPDLALKIAAGEVVERPASAVKELLDNAIDAGATQIRVEVRDAGLRLIRVSDDGCGIPREELPLAFASHATSKVEALDDLERLTTLGFRGEALAAIAAVSRVEVQTRAEDETAGTRLTVEYGNLLAPNTHAAPRGLRIAVSELFANVPARRKFVRSLRAESGQITAVVMQYAMAQPTIRFSLTLDEQQTFESPGTGQLMDALAAVYGPDVVPFLLPLQVEESGITIEGLMSAPELSRSNRAAIHVFCNGRPIGNRSIAFAFEEAYSGYLMAGRHPLAAIHLRLASDEVDANVHPSKSVVRFSRDREVHGIVHRAAVNTLLESRLSSPRIDLPVSELAGPVPMPLPLAPEDPNGSAMQQTDLLPQMPLLRVFGQTNQAFIIAEGPQGLYMIDQHAAHERVLFDQLDEQMAAGGGDAQPLLEPLTIDLEPAQVLALDENGQLLADIGFMVEPFGNGACLIRAIPAIGAGAAPAELVGEVLTELCSLPEPSAARERALAATACKAAVKAGQSLEVQEMRELVRRLERTARPDTCPHGRPTMIHLSHSQLEREFGRR